MRAIQYDLFVSDMLPDYPVEWEILPPDLFNRLLYSWRHARGLRRHEIETKGRIYVSRRKRCR